LDLTENRTLRKNLDLRENRTPRKIFGPNRTGDCGEYFDPTENRE
jgi:hypothetical protein